SNSDLQDPDIEVHELRRTAAVVQAKSAARMGLGWQSQTLSFLVVLLHDHFGPLHVDDKSMVFPRLRSGQSHLHALAVASAHLNGQAGGFLAGSRFRRTAV